MILPNDEDTIRRMLGVQEIPSGIEHEYQLWLRMHHRNGSSGPLGHHLCICLLRHIGLEPPAAVETVEAIDWRQVSIGTRVVVNDGRSNVYGVFKGKIDVGTVGVMLDNSAFVQEVNQRYVRPYVAHHPDLNLTDDEEFVAFETNATPKDIDLDATPDVDWDSVKRGDPVYIVEDESSTEGTFWQLKDGHVIVKVGSDKMSYPKEAVLPERK